MQPTALNSVLQAVESLATGLGNSVAPTSIPALQYTAPNVSDLSSQYQGFLTRAAKDPDIVNYYNQLLNTAQGDTNVAIGFLESDYQTGVRNAVQNLQGNLQNLAQSNQVNQVSQQDALNKRGIALTQNANGGEGYAGGGEAQTEVGNTQTQYALQQEAQQRSASQSVNQAASTLQKGTSQANQALTQQVQQYQGQYNTDVATRANTYQTLYDEQQAAAEKAAADKAAAQASQGSAQGSGNYFNRAANSGMLNGTTYLDINKWAQAGGNISTNAF